MFANNKQTKAEKMQEEKGNSSSETDSEYEEVFDGWYLAVEHGNHFYQTKCRYKAEELSGLDPQDKDAMEAASSRCKQRVRLFIRKYYKLHWMFLEHLGDERQEDEHEAPTQPAFSQEEGCGSAVEGEKLAPSKGSSVFKKMKSGLKRVFSRKPQKEFQQEEKDLDETVSSDNSNTTPDSPCHDVTPATASVFSEDIRDAEEADPTSDLLVTANADVLVEEETAEPSQALVEEEPGSEAGSPTSSSLVSVQTASDYDRTEKSVVTEDSSMYKKMKSAFRSFFRGTPKKKVQVEEDLVEDDESEDDNTNPGSSCSTEAVDVTTNLSCETAEFDEFVEHKGITPETSHDGPCMYPTSLSDYDKEGLSTDSDSEPDEESSSPRHSTVAYDLTPKTMVQPEQELSHLGAGDSGDESDSSDATEPLTPPPEEPVSSLQMPCVENDDVLSVEREDVDVAPAEEKISPATSPQQDIASLPDITVDVFSVEREEPSTTPSPDQHDGAFPPIILVKPAEGCPPPSNGPNEESQDADEACLSTVDLQPEDFADVDVAPAEEKTSPATSPQKDIASLPAMTFDVLSVEREEPSTTASPDQHDGAFPPIILVKPAEGSQQDIASLPAITFVRPREVSQADRKAVCQYENSGDVIRPWEDSIPGSSGQDLDADLKRSTEDNEETSQFTVLRNIFHTIMCQFFQSLTNRQREEFRNGVLDSQVKDKLADMITEVLKISMDSIMNLISDIIHQPNPRLDTCSTRSRSSSRSIKELDQKLLSEKFREAFCITEDNIEECVKCTFGKAFSDAVDVHTVSVTICRESIVEVIAQEVNSILSESLRASLDQTRSCVSRSVCCTFKCRACKQMLKRVVKAMKSTLNCRINSGKFAITQQMNVSDPESSATRPEDADTIIVPKEKSRKWLCRRKWGKRRVQPVSPEQMEKAIRASRLSSEDKQSLLPPAASTAVSEDRENKSLSATEAECQVTKTKRPSVWKRFLKLCSCCSANGEK